MRQSAIFYARILILLVAPQLLIACTGESTTTSSEAINIAVPQKIRQVQAIDSDQLSAELIVNGRAVQLQNNGTNVWMTDAMVPANNTTTLTVVWYETYQGVKLKLAQLTEEAMVGESGGSFVFSGTYATSGTGFDNDNDGISNFDERLLRTDPLLASDRPDTASINLSVDMPTRFVIMTDDYSVVAIVNGTNIPLTKNANNNYSASIDNLAANTTAEVIVSIESDQYANVTLAQAKQNISLVTDNNAVLINRSNFNNSFDTDNDGESNLREVERGRNPLTAYDYLVPKTSNPPTIDGELSDSAWRGKYRANGSTGAERLINRFIQSDSGTLTTDSLISEWAAVVNGDNLYIGIRVLDKSIHLDSGDSWDDDSIEIYLDGDNSKLSAFDGVNDFKMNFRLGDQSLESYPGSVPLPPNLVYELSNTGFDTDVAGSVFQTDIDRDAVLDKGFNLELSMSLSELGIQPDGAFGINIHFNDDDDGGSRDGKYAWIGEEGQDVDYLDPSKFGTAQIKAD